MPPPPYILLSTCLKVMYAGVDDDDVKGRQIGQVEAEEVVLGCVKLLCLKSEIFGKLYS